MDNIKLIKLLQEKDELICKIFENKLTSVVVEIRGEIARSISESCGTVWCDNYQRKHGRYKLTGRLRRLQKVTRELDEKIDQVNKKLTELIE